jgi:hypothetical protein
VADIDRRRAMVIGRRVVVTGHHLATVIGHRPATAAIAHLPVMVSVHRPAGTIALPAVVETGLRQEAAIVHRRMAAGLLAATEIAPHKVATVRAPKPSPQVNPQVNKSHDKRRDIRGVCHSSHGHQPYPVRA